MSKRIKEMAVGAFAVATGIGAMSGGFVYGFHSQDRTREQIKSQYPVRLDPVAEAAARARIYDLNQAAVALSDSNSAVRRDAFIQSPQELADVGEVLMTDSIRAAVYSHRNENASFIDGFIPMAGLAGGFIASMGGLAHIIGSLRRKQ